MSGFEKSKRLKKLHFQSKGKCYWCGRETVVLANTSLRKAAQKFGLNTKQSKWRKEVKYRSATIEHLVPKSKGGTIAWSNIVLACLQCNTARGNDETWQYPSGGVNND